MTMTTRVLRRDPQLAEPRLAAPNGGDKDPVPPGRPPREPVKEPPPRPGKPEPDPTPIDDPRPPKPKRLLRND